MGWRFVKIYLGGPGRNRTTDTRIFNPQTKVLHTQASQVPEGEAWLVKFAGADDSVDSCVLEEIYDRMARVCQLGMSPTELLTFPGGRFGFATQRFDRRGSARVLVHSLAGLLHASFQVQSVSYDDFFRVTRRLTKDQCELVRAVKICAVNVPMNNKDDHAKNLSFLREADGRWLLAPPYELTYCLGYRDCHCMDLAGAAKNVTRALVLAAAAHAGPTKSVASRAVDEVLAQVTPPDFLKLAHDLPLTVTTRDSVYHALCANHARLRQT